MTANREIELKLEIPAAGLRALERSRLLRGHNAGRKREELISVYFDTDSLKLRKKGVSLRVRRIGDHYVQTIKHNGSGNGAALDRDEWETKIENKAPDLMAARGTALEPLLSKKVRRALKPVFETRVHRTVYPIKNRTTEIELCLDKGRIYAGRESSPFREVELELKRGSPPELFRLAHQLTDITPLTLCVKSKAERGYELLTGARSAPIKSISFPLSPKLSTQASFKVIASACLHQLIANAPALRNGDSEALHQARVSMRRLRAAISLFSDLLQDEQTKAVKRDLKWLTGEFGPARELDVFMERVVKPIAGHARDKKGSAGLKNELRTSRQDAFVRAQSAVETARYRSLVLSIATWIESGDWTDDPSRALRERPIAKTASEQLDRRWRKILKRGKHLDALDTRKRHKLRIAVKTLRYASDFFRDVFPQKKAARRRNEFVSGLKKLQDCLGDLNDITVNERFSAQLGRRKPGASQKGQVLKAFTAGQFSGREEVRSAMVLKSAGKAYRIFTGSRPYWD